MIPTREQFVELVQALLSNATDLVSDARLLLEQNRFARAYALAALAGEELGKVETCLTGLLQPGETHERAFSRAWRDHGDKLASLTAYRAAFVDAVEQVELASLAEATAQIVRRKMTALYVDFDDSGIVTPNEISRVEAADLLGRVEGAVQHARAALGIVSLEVVAAARELAAHVLGPVGEQLDSLPPEQVLVALRAVMERLPDLSDAALREAIANDEVLLVLGLDLSQPAQDSRREA